MRAAVGLLLALILLPLTADACCAVRRSSTVTAFRKTHPCPSTGKTSGACPSWVVDHRVQLCLGEEAGGVDTVANLAWMEVRASYEKDTLERAQCKAAGSPCATHKEGAHD